MSKARSTLISSLASSSWTLLLLGLSTFAGYEVLKVVEVSDLPGLQHLPAFLLTPLTTQTEHKIIITLAAVIIGFSVLFLLGYVFKALIDSIRLAFVTRELKGARESGMLEDPASVLTEWHWSAYPLFSRLWREFAESLHRQPNPKSSAENRTVQYRSSMPAEIIFNSQSLVDIPLRVEFFRHLPGILTGAGIVSTFAGILVGLTEFNPVVEAELVTQELKNLFVGVSTAFVASFFAIFTAIIITVIEKLILHWRYSQVVKLQAFLDDCFKAGAEPEYLARIVENGDTGMQHLEAGLEKLAASLKQPTNFKETGNTENLEAMIVQLSETLAVDRKETVQALDLAIREGFAAPLRVISKAIELNLAEQGRRQEEIRKLENRLAGFGERMDVALRELARGMKGFNEAIAKLDESHGASIEKISTTISKTSHHEKSSPSADMAFFKTIANELKELRNNQNQDKLESSKQSEDLVIDFSNRLQETLASFARQLPSQEGMEQLLDLLKQGSNAGITEAKDSAQSIVKAIESSGDKQENTILKAMHDLEAATAARLQDSTKEITQTFKENINRPADGVGNEIKEAMAAVTKEILSADNAPSADEIVYAISSASSRQEAVMSNILKALENNINSRPDFSPQDIANVITDSVNRAVAESTDGLKDAVTDAALEILTADDSASALDIISAISSASANQEALIADILKALQAKPDEKPSLSAQEITAAINDGINRALANQHQEPKETAGQDIIAAIDNSNARQETLISNLLHTLQSQASDNPNLSAQEITDTITNAIAAQRQEPQDISLQTNIEDHTEEDFQLAQDIISAISSANARQEALMSKMLETLEAKSAANPNLSPQEISKSITEAIESSMADSSDKLKDTVMQAALSVLPTDDGPSAEEIISAISSASTHQETLMSHMIRALESANAATNNLSAEQISQSIADSVNSAMAESSAELKEAISEAAMEVMSLSDTPLSADEIITAIGNANSNQERIMGRILQTLESKTAESPQVSADEISQSIAQSIDTVMSDNYDGIKKAVKKAIKETFADNNVPSTEEIITAIQLATAQQEDVVNKILKEVAAQTSAEIKESAGDITESIAETINNAMTENSDEIKKAVKKAAKDILNPEGQPSNQEILTAVNGQAAKQESTLSDSIKDMTEQTSAAIKESAENLANNLEESINNVVSEGYDGIKAAVYEGSNGITEAVSAGFDGINRSVADGYQDVKEEVYEKSEEIKKAVYEGLGDVKNVVSEQSDGIKQVVAASSIGLKDVISNATKEIIAASGGENFKEILDKMHSSTDRLEKYIAKTFRDLDANNSNRLKTSSREIVSSLGKKVEGSTKEILVATSQPPAPDALPSREFLTEFKDHLNKLIVSLANRINHVGGRVADERKALEENLKVLEISLQTITEAQGKQTKEHMDNIFSTSQEHLKSGISQLGGSIQDELNQLQNLIKETSGDLSTHMKSQQPTTQHHQQQEETIKRLESEFKSTMHELNTKQEESLKNREQELIGQVLASNNKANERLQASIKEEIAETKQSIAKNIQEAREEQSAESSELSQRISLISNISDKMSNSVSDITAGLDQLRDKVTTEKEVLNSTMKGWVDDLASTNKAGTKEIASQIKGVIEQVDNRHDGMIKTINKLNHGMGNDLKDMKEKILKSGMDSERNLAESLSKMGQGVEETVQRTSDEQSAYIELLGERMEAMRRKLRVK
ncbi:MAG: hypothetical protein HQL70_06415 [Magnetococcales bacterium]|nr:hypothetical protein [Magnetococcales bacterium]